MTFTEFLNSPDSDYHKQVFKALGYEPRTDFDTGTTNWVDRYAQSGGETERVKPPGDETLDEYFQNQLAGFGDDPLGRPRFGTAGYVDPGSRRDWMNGDALNPVQGDPSLQNAFAENATLNGKTYWRNPNTFGGVTYDEFAKDPLGAKLIKGYGLTPSDFRYDKTYGNLLEQNPRTTAAVQAVMDGREKAKNGTFNDSLIAWLSAAGMFAGPIIGAAGAAGAGAAEAGAGEAGAGAFGAGGAADGLLEGAQAFPYQAVPEVTGTALPAAGTGASVGSLLSNPFVRAGSSIISSILNSGGSSGGSSAQGAGQTQGGVQPQGLISDFSGLNLGIKPSGNPLTDQAGKPIFGNGIISNVRRG